jgi:hypothetical protein
MTNPARLYDGNDDSGLEIALVTLTVQSRLALPAVPAAKGRDGWSIVLPGGDSGLTRRVLAEGHFGPGWIETLYDRQEARSTDNYFVALAHGDSHSGKFIVEVFDELVPAESHRRFRLVLLSSERIIYTPA